jgi:hypothetical protein
VRREPLSRAIQRGDITLALTPTQLVFAAIGAYLLLRFLRGLRG